MWSLKTQLYISCGYAAKSFKDWSDNIIAYMYIVCTH